MGRGPCVAVALLNRAGSPVPSPSLQCASPSHWAPWALCFPALTLLEEGNPAVLPPARQSGDSFLHAAGAGLAVSLLLRNSGFFPLWTPLATSRQFLPLSLQGDFRLLFGSEPRRPFMWWVILKVPQCRRGQSRSWSLRWSRAVSSRRVTAGRTPQTRVPLSRRSPHHRIRPFKACDPLVFVWSPGRATTATVPFQTLRVFPQESAHPPAVAPRRPLAQSPAAVSCSLWGFACPGISRQCNCTRRGLLCLSRSTVSSGFTMSCVYQCLVLF